MACPVIHRLLSSDKKPQSELYHPWCLLYSRPALTSAFRLFPLESHRVPLFVQALALLY